MNEKHDPYTAHRNNLESAIQNYPYTVFLCGPTLSRRTKGSRLRAKVLNSLKDNGYTVVLGEDDGLEEPRLKLGADAHTNEATFVKENHCQAIVLIAASSPSALCELGLFSYLTTEIPNDIDFILIMERKYENNQSYINVGPAQLVKSFGTVIFENFDTYDGTDIIKRLNTRRARMAVRGK
ncbi:MAG: hypothetical protein OEV66_12775, partial [Spirochaetia bacterium]|nr:hypothetical protein [Spirochaetia bacterium]